MHFIPSLLIIDKTIEDRLIFFKHFTPCLIPKALRFGVINHFCDFSWIPCVKLPTAIAAHPYSVRFWYASLLRDLIGYDMVFFHSTKLTFIPANFTGFVAHDTSPSICPPIYRNLWITQTKKALTIRPTNSWFQCPCFIPSAPKPQLILIFYLILYRVT